MAIRELRSAKHDIDMDKGYDYAAWFVVVRAFQRTLPDT